jgi:hypothetical protein
MTSSFSISLKSLCSFHSIERTIMHILLKLSSLLHYLLSFIVSLPSNLHTTPCVILTFPHHIVYYPHLSTPHRVSSSPLHTTSCVILTSPHHIVCYSHLIYSLSYPYLLLSVHVILLPFCTIRLSIFDIGSQYLIYYYVSSLTYNPLPCSAEFLSDLFCSFLDSF